jgi:hypothetical protein
MKSSIKKLFCGTLSLAVALLLAACGGGAGGSANTPVASGPTVSSTSPANNATAVAVNAAITATFSGSMDPSTVTNADFTLKNGATSVAGTVNCSGTSATFSPSSALANSTTYTATISTGVKDLAGNAMASAKTWTFTTAGTPIPTVVIAPKTATVTQGNTFQFRATVGGTTNTAVTWSASGGSMANGLYTASSTGTYTVTVTTQATPTASDTATVTVVASGAYLTPGNVTGDVVVSMDSHTTTAISPFIYGLNVADQSGNGNLYSTWGTYLPKFTFNRYGGNNTTPLNWETGYTNAGADWQYLNYDYPLASAGGSAGTMPVGPGNAFTPRIDFAHAHNAAQLVTVPIIGYVAKDASGAQPLLTAPDAMTPATPDPAHWLQALPSNPAGATANPNTTDGFVYTDDFVKWMDAKYPNAKTDPVKSIQYELDNEPDLWSGTHPEIRGRFNGNDIPTEFDELVNKTAVHAKAVKSQVPNAVVYGGAFALWDALVNLKHAAAPTGYTYYLDYFLEKMKLASDAAGTRLMDVVDFHWYPQGGQISNNYATQNTQAINDREQEPRSLWDNSYRETSWVAGAVPDEPASNCDSRGYCPIYFLPRMQAHIDKFYPGTKIAIGEYSYGRGGDISAAIANADALGIFGKYGVYAATMWPLGNEWAYNLPANNCNGDGTCVLTHARRCELMAIDIYRNYDSNNAKFGDTSIATSIADATFTSPATQNERLTAYASMDAGNPNRVVMVAINKAATSLNAGLKITHTKAFSTAEVWQVTGVNGDPGGCTAPTRQADISLPVTNGFNASLPAQSVTVFVLK